MALKSMLRLTVNLWRDLQAHTERERERCSNENVWEKILLMTEFIVQNGAKVLSHPRFFSFCLQGARLSYNVLKSSIQCIQGADVNSVLFLIVKIWLVLQEKSQCSWRFFLSGR